MKIDNNIDFELGFIFRQKKSRLKSPHKGFYNSAVLKVGLKCMKSCKEGMYLDP
jgi:hypothetical protein